MNKLLVVATAVNGDSCNIITIEVFNCKYLQLQVPYHLYGILIREGYTGRGQYQ